MKPRKISAFIALGAGVALGRVAARAARTYSNVPGRRKKAGTVGLEVGARVLQRRTPLDQFDLYLVGFHPLRDDPDTQMEAHHYCRVVNEDFIQCVVFDGGGPQARLTGVEFIISEHLFRTLSPEEQASWHPHNYEILSGQLVAPQLPAAAEDRLMRRMMNSYGKTWHFWMSRQDNMPLGDACLAWSFNRDGELDPKLLRRRNQRMRIDAEEKRQRRQPLAEHARPQQGEDLLEGRFERGERAEPTGREPPAEEEQPAQVTEVEEEERLRSWPPPR